MCCFKFIWSTIRSWWLRLYNFFFTTDTGDKKRDKKYKESTRAKNGEQTFLIDKENCPNLHFYRNEIKSEPNGDFIENILKWRGDYNKLEFDHNYIQWLFPNREPGLNRKAFCLTDYEAKEISKDPLLRDRVLRSFHMMLDFYGMTMYGNKQIIRSSDYKARFANLNMRSHNFLRITRILITLGELNFLKEQINWLEFLKEIVASRELDASSSLERFWIPAVAKYQTLPTERTNANYQHMGESNWNDNHHSEIFSRNRSESANQIDSNYADDFSEDA
ncbi:opioid growth factor receptor-like protein 1 [Argonauta hians]